MARTRVVVHHGKPMKALFDEWAATDGTRRAQRVAGAMEAAGIEDIVIVPDSHPGRTALHIGSNAPGAFYREAQTGDMARALDAAG